MFRYYTQPNIVTWRDRAKMLKAIRAEWDANMAIMTPYEQQLTRQYYTEQKEQHENAILNGAIAEWNTGVNNLKGALKNVEKAKTNEINRWQSPRLRDEMQVYRMLMEQAAGSSRNDPSEARGKMEKIYNEAQKSGDLYKQRAAAEVFTGVLAHFQSDVTNPDYLAMNRIAKRAENDLQTMRQSEELTRAHEAAARAADALNGLRDGLVKAADCLGQVAPNGNIHSTPVLDALARVKVIDGQFVIED